MGLLLDVPIPDTSMKLRFFKLKNQPTGPKKFEDKARSTVGPCLTPKSSKGITRPKSRPVSGGRTGLFSIGFKVGLVQFFEIMVVLKSVV